MIVQNHVVPTPPCLLPKILLGRGNARDVKHQSAWSLGCINVNSAPFARPFRRESPPCFHRVCEQNTGGMVVRSGIDDCREPALGCVEVARDQSVQCDLMKVSNLKLGGVYTALTAQKLEQLVCRRTTRDSNPVKVMPLKALACLRPHPTLDRDARAINLVECLQVAGEVHDVTNRCIGGAMRCPDGADHR
jgi:hypothetical protein